MNQVLRTKINPFKHFKAKHQLLLENLQETYILDLTIYRNIALHLYSVSPVRRISVRIDILIQP
jgi:hypothetical protein